MKITAQDTARALLELSRALPDGESFLRDVQKELSKHVKAEETLQVTIITPAGDAGSRKEVITDLLKKKLNRPVEITEKADKSILGGAVITFGDEQIDMSVRGALQQAVQAFSGARA